MGEWSKKIGEYGEEIVEKILSVIGWNQPMKGIEIECLKLNGEHCNEKGNSVHTHGIDFLFSYLNPLVDGQLNNVIISSKFKTSKYPNSPTKEFKWFLTDLINQVECFDISQLKEDILAGFRNYSSINDIGLLFWLNNDKESDDDLIGKVSSARIDSVSNKTIFIIDNKRAGFILEVMRFLKSQNRYNYYFYYPSTGRNLNPVSRNNTGKILPVEYLNSSIIPIKMVNIDNCSETSFMLATIDNFDKDTFTRLIGLAKDISTNLSGNVVIGFPDYDKLKHETIVNQAKQGFDDMDFTRTIKVTNFRNPIETY